MKKHDWFKCYWHVRHIRDGKVIWEDYIRNSLANEGEEAMLEVFFRNDVSYAPTQFFVRLCNDSLVDTDTLLLVLNEPSGNGYAAQLLERSAVGFPTKEIDAGDYQIVSKVITFTASGGDIGPVNTNYIATTSDNSGKLIAFLTLSMTRTILNGDSMEVQPEIKLS